MAEFANFDPNHPYSRKLRQTVLGPCVMLMQANYETLANENPHRQKVRDALLRARDVIRDACVWEEVNNADRSMLSESEIDSGTHRLRMEVDPEYIAELDKAEQLFKEFKDQEDSDG